MSQVIMRYFPRVPTRCTGPFHSILTRLLGPSNTSLIGDEPDDITRNLAALAGD